MARVAATPSQPADPSAISLTRLLSHLENILLSPEAETQLLRSQYERTKVGANLEYARSLLLKLEHDSARIKIQSRKQSIQSDLQAKREVIRKLNLRLVELNRLDDSGDDEDDIDSESSGDEDASPRPSYAPAVKGASNTLDYEGPTAQQNPALRSVAENFSSTIRSRHPQQPATANPTTGRSTGSTRYQAGSEDDASRKDQILSYNREDQDSMTNALVRMAQELKQSANKFHTSLEKEKAEGILDRAVEGLDKNITGMEAAGRRMGTLRRMTEGKGWWGRMMLYAWIAGLWILALVIVFVLPKLRF